MFLEIRLVGNPRCRKEFSCFIFDKVVDSDICNFKDFVDEIVEKYPPGYHERVTVAYLDDASQNYLEVKSDQELLAMFAKYTKSKAVSMAIAYTLPTEIPQWPTVPEPTHEPTSSQHSVDEPASSQHMASQPSTPQADDDDDILRNPELENEFVGVTTGK
jgi:hypothetical protein